MIKLTPVGQVVVWEWRMGDHPGWSAWLNPQQIADLTGLGCGTRHIPFLAITARSRSLICRLRRRNVPELDRSVPVPAGHYIAIWAECKRQDRLILHHGLCRARIQIPDF
jgi:hypothetical protein